MIILLTWSLYRANDFAHRANYSNGPYLRGEEYLLGRYATLENLEPLVKNGIKYTLQRPQGQQKNEIFFEVRILTRFV